MYYFSGIVCTYIVTISQWQICSFTLLRLKLPFSHFYHASLSEFKRNLSYRSQDVFSLQFFHIVGIRRTRESLIYFFFFKFYYLISFYCFLYFFLLLFFFFIIVFFCCLWYIYTYVWQKLVFSTLWFLKLNRLSFWYPFSLSLLPESLWCFFTVLHFSLFFIAGILFLMLFSYLQDRIFSFECKNFSKSKSRCNLDQSLRIW